MAGITPPSPPSVNPDRIRTLRVTTGALLALATATVTVTWAPAFADANYTVTVGVLEGQADDTIQVKKIVSRTAGAITVLVMNNGAQTRTGTVHAIAIHDA